ncbi:prolipoprotein diacylglyceryl transferase [Geobacter sp. OR-1]|uniref:prolipoprotein diacylglyceryl transferase n=1 Tax=Geobacter sp. OR-1 TaxID=1266765 RepID=UPI0005427064|nr:prolipoprotein diacylglyceryl transferase [Geobacter sp. OR-1]GAM10616.1 prolipoprotein diacylglyceryl transferase [Geobacter sp. OR-1]
MTFPAIDPVFLRIGPLEMRWYGLMYILAFTAAYFIIGYAVKNRNISLSKDGVTDLVFAVAVGIIVGGRLGYILFYNLGYYLANPLKLLAVWEGGMSFHGGFAGAVISGILFCRKRKLNFLEIADIGFLTAPIGLMFGRIGNFINGELYGRVTDMHWGIVFPGGGNLPRHPSQLYESFLEGPATFLLIWLIWRGKRPAGSVLCGFIACYGMFRTIVEFYREPDQQIGYIAGIFSMGQMLSLPMFIAGTAMFIHLNRKTPPSLKGATST